MSCDSNSDELRAGASDISSIFVSQQRLRMAAQICNIRVSQTGNGGETGMKLAVLPHCFGSGGASEIRFPCQEQCGSCICSGPNLTEDARYSAKLPQYWCGIVLFRDASTGEHQKKAQSAPLEG